ncbi:hypothetical protein PanWU01x14_360380 [Parasponia andersonii]|uniref:Uncharacterized protein n=1 Tax=Parasponia andersonii TaxID=3476 RepID=A0A2P5A7M6_PARAD|nr:hypothetical protein PanWU01x14_360380 [Parasponia andersonii]
MIRVNIVRVASSIVGSHSVIFNPSSSWQTLSAPVQSGSAKIRSRIMATSSYAMLSDPLSRRKLLFRQLFEKDSSTYNLLAHQSYSPSKTCSGWLIEPVDKMVERDLSLVKELGLKPIYAMNTHVC